MISITILFGLLVCHFLADFTHLSMPFMLKAKQKGTPQLPIITHASTHGLLMLLFLLTIGINNMFLLYIILTIEIVSHWLIDMLKGKCNVWFPKLKDISYKGFWYMFGFDQLLHISILIILSYLINIF